jgi:hypothetical protein
MLDSILKYKLGADCDEFKVQNKCTEADDMEKFKIPTIPHTTSKSIRFPNNMIEDVEESIKGENCTFTAFVVEAVRVALVNLAEDESENEP